MYRMVVPLDVEIGHVTFYNMVTTEIHIFQFNGPIVQLARTSALHAGGREFESHWVHKKYLKFIFKKFGF